MLLSMLPPRKGNLPSFSIGSSRLQPNNYIEPEYESYPQGSFQEFRGGGGPQPKSLKGRRKPRRTPISATVFGITSRPSPPQPSTFTMDLVEEMTKRTLKEEKDKFMPILLDGCHILSRHKLCPLSSPEIRRREPTSMIIRVKWPNPIEHIPKHKFLFLDLTSDDNHFTLLFPTILTTNASSLFFGLT